MKPFKLEKDLAVASWRQLAGNELKNEASLTFLPFAHVACTCMFSLDHTSIYTCAGFMIKQLNRP